MSAQSVAAVLGLAMLAAALLIAALIAAQEGLRRQDGFMMAAAMAVAVLAVFEAMAALHVWRFVP